MKYPILLFDFDGVLAKTEDIFFQALNYSLEKLKEEPVSYDHFRRYSKYELLQQRNYGKLKIALLILFAKSFMKSNIRRAALHKDVFDVLKNQKQDKYIISSNSIKNMKALLKEENKYFKKIFSAKGFMGKEKILNQFPKTSLYITDEVRDIIECRKVGLTVAAVTWGFDSENSLKKHRPDFLIKTPEELKSIFNLENE